MLVHSPLKPVEQELGLDARMNLKIHSEGSVEGGLH